MVLNFLKYWIPFIYFFQEMHRMIEIVLVALVCHVLQQSLGAGILHVSYLVACSFHLTPSMTSGGQLSAEHDLHRSPQYCSILTPSLGCS